MHRAIAWRLVAVAGVFTATVVSPNLASAEHTIVTASVYGVTPPWQGGDPWNGYKVFLSSPRHADSRSRGECGWEENINGRNWNYEAAFWTTPGGSIGYRGYDVIVSSNQRDNGFLANRTLGNNYGANVYVITHSNAAGSGCNSSQAQYILGMFRSNSQQSIDLTNWLLWYVDPVVPNGRNQWSCDNLAECNDGNYATYRSYIELFFHTNGGAVNWYQCCTQHGAAPLDGWRYGAAIDSLLGYP